MKKLTKSEKEMKKVMKMLEKPTPFKPVEYLLMETDPKNKKNKNKKQAVKPLKIRVKTVTFDSVILKHLKPIIGLGCSPYLFIRPLVKWLSVVGNDFFDKLFN